MAWRDDDVARFHVAVDDASRMQRGKQKRTASDLQAIGGALASRAEDAKSYPAASSIDELAGLLEPTYVQQLPRLDPWQGPYRYWSWRSSDEPDAPLDRYCIGSAGRDGKWEHEAVDEYKAGATTDPGADILLANGELARYPEGMAPSAP